MKILLILLLSVYTLYAQNSDEIDYYKMKKVAYNYYESGKVQKAFETVNRFIVKYPQNLRAKNLLAHFYFWEGKVSQSKVVLEKITDKKGLPEAVHLLTRIKAALSKKTTVTKREKIQTSDNRIKRKKNNMTNDLTFLMEEVKKNPTNIQDRTLLLHYFLSLNKIEEVKKMAQEILDIDPDNIDILALLKANNIHLEQKKRSSVNPKLKMDKIITVLNRYNTQKSYRRFINLYNALYHHNIYVPEYIHLDALNAAVELHEYRIAKKILLSHHFPDTAHLRELRAILDAKLKVAFSM